MPDANVQSADCPPVRPLWRFVAFTSILLVGMVLFLVLQVPPEPVYRGKTLTRWLGTYAPSSSAGRHSREWNEADDAVRNIGTNCIPVLLRMIGEKDFPLKLRLVALAKKYRLMKNPFVPAVERNVEASRAFIILGDMAKDAVPALVRVHGKNISADSQSAIEDALAWIGPAAKPAVPLLLRSATNSNAKVRANALWALGEIHGEPQLCVPALIHALSDSDGWARASAAHALGMFGTDAQSAIPSLRELTNIPRGFESKNIQLSLEVRTALRKISPRADSPASETFPGLGTPGTDGLLFPQ
jgi:hypothetical protein